MSESRPRRPLEVLLVEDNSADVGLVRQGLRGLGESFTLHVAMDGLEAMRFIEAKRPRPDLIILDINLPGLNGHEVLRRLKQSQEHREIPVVVFSSSDAVKDIRTAYGLSANSYVKKPADLDEFFEAVAGIERFWLQTALLPL